MPAAGGGRPRRLLLLGGLGALALAGAVLGGILLASRGGDDNAGACVEGAPGVEAFPPTTGAVNALPVAWGRYGRPVAQHQLVHNLSHGGVAVQYGPEVPAATIAEIRAWYLADPDGIVLAPHESLDDLVVMTAWGRLEVCRGFDEAAFSSFRDAFRFHGPEQVSPEAMRPGAGGKPVGLLEGLALAPRPFVRTLAITFLLGDDAVLNVEVEDERGRPVRVLGPAALQRAGAVRMTWDRRDDRGRVVPAGVYLVRVEAATGSDTATASARAEAGRL
jgi:hypothetical protein